MPSLAKLTKGQWYWVTWADACTSSSPIEDIKQAGISYRTLPLRYMGNKIRKHPTLLNYQNKPITCKYATFSLIEDEENDSSQGGWWAIPIAMIKHVSLIQNPASIAISSA